MFMSKVEIMKNLIEAAEKEIKKAGRSHFTIPKEIKPEKLEGKCKHCPLMQPYNIYHLKGDI